MRRNKYKTIVLILLIVIALWLFFREPVWFGEANADKLEMKDREHTEEVLAQLPEEKRGSLEEYLLREHHDNMVLLKYEDQYYGFVSVNAMLAELDFETFNTKELFQLHQYACGIKQKDHKLYFMSGKLESRDGRGPADRFIHPSKTRVLTEISCWCYDFDAGSLEEISKWKYFF
ncbi:MAG: hypothetical protein ACI4LA_10445 [Emergencia sp.]